MFRLKGLDDALDAIDDAQKRVVGDRRFGPPEGLSPAPRIDRQSAAAATGVPPRLADWHATSTACEAADGPDLATVAPIVGPLSETAMLYALPCSRSAGRVSYRLYLVETGEIGGIDDLAFAGWSPRFGWFGTDTLDEAAYDPAAGCSPARPATSAAAPAGVAGPSTPTPSASTVSRPPPPAARRRARGGRSIPTSRRADERRGPHGRLRAPLFPPSPFGRKVKIAAAILGLSDRIEIKATDTLSPTDSIRDENPLGKIPALIRPDGLVLFDSRVIVEYLDHLAGGGRILPAEPEARFDALRLQALADGLMDAALLRRYEVAFRPEGQRSATWDARQSDKIARALAALESDPPSADTVTVGEIAVACALGYLDFRFEGTWRADHPKLVAFLDAFAAKVSAFEATRAH